MSGTGWLNLGSLVLGLIAWILPGIQLMQHRKTAPQNQVLFSLASVSACAISLGIQIFALNQLVKTEDWSALMDISPAVVLVSSILLAGTLILNTITFVVSWRDKTTG